MIKEIPSRVVSICGGILLAIITAGPICNEDLPPYSTPQDYLKGSIRGGYVITDSDNSVKIYLDVTNRYDETLEGHAVLSGEMEISLLRNPAFRKSFVITPDNLLTPNNYNTTTGEIRIDPGETIRFGVSWDLVDENGTDLRDSVFQYWVDPECPNGGPPSGSGARCVAEEERFVILGSVDVFSQTGHVVAGPEPFILCHVNKFVFGSFCSLIDYGNPCSKRAVTAPAGQRCPKFVPG
ncbi:MAG: hypothetical protein WEB33_06375 [Bacteroidota bacterium]